MPAVPIRCLPLLALLLAGCGASSPPRRAAGTADTRRPGLVEVTSLTPTWRDSSEAWQYRPTLTIQPAHGSPGALSRPSGIVVDEWGRIYVADKDSVSIKLFDSTGKFVRTIGRPGWGPGEYASLFLAVRGGHLVVHDPQLGRASLFDTSGTFVHSWPTSSVWNKISIDSAGLITVPSSTPPGRSRNWWGVTLSRFRLDGTLVDTLFVPVRKGNNGWTFAGGSYGRKTFQSSWIPFAPRQVMRFHPDGGLVLGWTGEYRIFRSARGEDTTAIYTRAWTPGRIPEARRRAALEEVVKSVKDFIGEASARDSARLADIPADEPAYTSLAVDLDGNIFARQFAGSDSTRTRFDVFSPAGAWLGSITLPVALPEQSVEFFGRRAIYVVANGKDGRPSIVRLTRGN